MTSAGQVEQFAYCAHNWFLARAGAQGEGAASQRGLAQHQALGQEQQELETEARESRDGLRISLQLVVLATSVTALVLVVTARDAFGVGRQLTMAILGLVLVSGSAALLSIGLLAQQRHRRRQQEARLAPGRLVSSDLLGLAPVLSDPDWDLTGRPDYILATQEGMVPVEVKTGRTPDRPHASHVMQLACYLRLVEVRDGRPPPYGLVSYPDGFFRVDWTPQLRAELRATLDRLREAEAQGRADRDHDKPGRCRGCSRRDACDQRLA